MKEIEMKEKWCPFSRVPRGLTIGDAVVINREFSGDAPSNAKCLGLNCACWKYNGISDGICGLTN